MPSALAAPHTVLSLEERFNADRMLSLLKNDHGLDAELKRKLKSLYAARVNGNRIRVTYDLAKNCKADDLGRLVAAKGLSLGCVENTVRAALCQDYYWDVDMANAHPVLLLGLAKRHGWPAQQLERYVTEREAVLAELVGYGMPDRSAAKRAMQVMMYLGPIALLRHAPRDYDYLAAFRGEMDLIATAVASAYPRAAEIAKAKKRAGMDASDPVYHSSALGVASCLSLVLGGLERRALLAAVQAVEALGRTVGPLIYDGFMVEKLPGEETLAPEVLDACRDAAREALEHGMDWAVKPMTTNIVFPDEEEAKAEPEPDVNDAFAAKTFVELVGRDNFAVHGEQLLVFDDATGMWTHKDRILRGYAIRHAAKLTWRVPFPVHYGGDDTRMTKMIKMVPQFVEAYDNFWEERLETSIGKLLFMDGIYDFETDAFTRGFDPAVVFKGRIRRPFCAAPDASDVAWVRKVVFEDVYTDEQRDAGVPLFQQIAIARALFGDYLARVAYYTVGESSTGKGVLQDAMFQSFMSYVAHFNVESLQISKGGDSAKALSWVMAICHARIAVSSEASRSVVLDGNILKKLVSGGDTMTARTNFKDETTVINRATPFVSVNDMPTIEPLDDAVANRNGGVIETKIRFLDPESEDYRADDPMIKLQDTSVRAAFKLARFQDAFTAIILEAYRVYKREGHVVPGVVKEARTAWMPRSSDKVKDLLEQRYITTTNDHDAIQWSDLEKFLTVTNDCGLSKTKLSRHMTNLGYPPKFLRPAPGAKPVQCRLRLRKRSDLGFSGGVGGVAAAAYSDSDSE